MDASLTNIDRMTEAELKDLLKSAQEALDRLVAKRARSTLKEAKRMAAEVGFEITFVKTGKPEGGKAKPQSSRAKVLPKYRNPDNPDETWSGRGRQPKWVQAALAEGQTLEDFAIPATEPAAAA
jgi:DNA-binding protein H-NS